LLQPLYLAFQMTSFMISKALCSVNFYDDGIFFVDNGEDLLYDS
jgi:hypothetical protein